MTYVGAVNVEGTIQANISEEDIAKAEPSENGTLLIRLQADGGATIHGASLDVPIRSVLERSDRIKEIQLDMGVAKVTLAVSSELFSDGSQNLSLHVRSIDPSSLEEEHRAFVGAAPVYDFELSVDERPLASFRRSHPVEVEVPYAFVDDGKTSSGKVVMYYLGDDGTIEAVTNSKYIPSAGTVRFKPDHFSRYAPVYTDVAFLDMQADHWARESAEALAARGIVFGTGDGAFQPDRDVTRAEFVRMLLGAMQAEATAQTSSFTDVSAGAWYASAVATAERLGIAKGRADGTFGVDEPIARQDMAVMTVRAAAVLGVDLGSAGNAIRFADESSIAEYAVESVDRLQRSGLLQGMGDGTFRPLERTSRAHAAAVIYKWLLML
jgi:hypothetical protein